MFGKVLSSVTIIHHHTEDMLVSVTGCHHHRTDPQNLWKENRNTSITLKLRNSFCHKAALQVGGLEGCKVIKVKGSGNAPAEESAECPSCGSDSLWGQRSAGEPYEHAWEYVPHPLFSAGRVHSKLTKIQLKGKKSFSFLINYKTLSRYCSVCLQCSMLYCVFAATTTVVTDIAFLDRALKYLYLSLESTEM